MELDGDSEEYGSGRPRLRGGRRGTRGCRLPGGCVGKRVVVVKVTFFFGGRASDS